MANPTGPHPNTLLNEFSDMAIRGARRIAFAHGWRRLGLACVAGVLAALALAPFYAIPGVVLGMTLLVWVIDGLDEGLKGAVEALSAGAAFGLGYFGVAFYGFWLADPVGLALVGWASVFPAIAVLAAHRLWTAGPERGLTLAVALSGAEWCRGHLFGGLPLALIGPIWAEIPQMLQITAWIGVYGLSLITFAVSSAIAGGLPNPSFAGHGSSDKTHLILWWPGAAMGVLLLVFFAGLMRLSGEALPATGQTFLRIVTAQEGVCDLDPADLQRNSSLPERNLKYSDFSMLIIPGPSCGTGFLSEREGGTDIVAAWIEKGQVAVVQSARRARQGGVYDALHVIDVEGQIRATYDRSHGLPFGLGPKLSAHPAAPVSLGGGPRTYAPSDVPEFGLLVGIDVAASGAVVDRAKRPAWLLNVSDERGAVSGTQKQFVDAARLRAVEEGLPLVRGAAGGMSIVVDAYGRMVGGSGAHQSGLLDLALPAPLPPTFYARIGDLAALLAMLCAGGLAYGIAKWRLPSVRAA